MSAAPTGKIGQRARRRAADSDDEEDTVVAPPTTTTTATDGASSVPATTEDADSSVGAARPPTRLKPKAPSARAAAATSVDTGSTTAAGTTDSSGEVDGDDVATRVAHTDPNASAMSPASLLTMDYDDMTYDAFLAILAGVSKDNLWPVIENRVDALLESTATRAREQSDEENEKVDGEGDGEGVASSERVRSERLEKYVDGSGGYTYSFLLRRICEALKLNNEQSATTERNKIPMPVIEKLGKKKTVMVNFGSICSAIGRTMEDVKDFLDKELSTQGSIDSNSSLIMKIQAVKPNQFDNVLFKYLDDYVKCNSCHKINTTLTKEGRITVLKCNLCKASRTVQAMGSATYNAQIGKRSKARLQALTL